MHSSVSFTLAFLLKQTRYLFGLVTVEGQRRASISHCQRICLIHTNYAAERKFRVQISKYNAHIGAVTTGPCSHADTELLTCRKDVLFIIYLLFDSDHKDPYKTDRTENKTTQ